MNNREGSLTNKEILVDTSFLLPALGIDVEEIVYQAIKKFKKYNVYYLDVSLLEAMWIILKKVSYEDKNTVRIGIESIRNTYRKLEVTAEHLIMAWEIYENAHKDFIDNILYSVSHIENKPFLTIDKKLKKNLKNAGYSVKNIIFPSEL